MNSNADLNTPKIAAPWPWYAAAVLFFCVDRALKALALSGTAAGWAGKVEFVLFLNTGIAFSIPVPAALFWSMATLALALLLYMFARSLRRTPHAAGIIFFIIAGALSNLYDRVIYGATVDYLMFFGRSAVNLADGMILGGLVWLAVRERADSAP